MRIISGFPFHDVNFGHPLSIQRDTNVIWNKPVVEQPGLHHKVNLHHGTPIQPDLLVGSGEHFLDGRSFVDLHLLQHLLHRLLRHIHMPTSPQTTGNVFARPVTKCTGKAPNGGTIISSNFLRRSRFLTLSKGQSCLTVLTAATVYEPRADLGRLNHR